MERERTPIDDEHDAFMRWQEREFARELAERDDPVDVAATWLRFVLHGGPMPARTVRRRASRAGVELTDLLAAKSQLDVVEQRTRRGPDGDTWALPGQVLPAQVDRPQSKKARQRARRRVTSITTKAFTLKDLQ